MIRQNPCPELFPFDRVVAPNAIYSMDRWSAESPFALGTWEWWTKDADRWNPLHQGALHRVEELRDDVLAAIEATF